MASHDQAITIGPAFERPDMAQVAELGSIPTSIIGDGIGRRGSLGPRVQALTRACAFAGPALTVRCRAGDNLAALVALNEIEPGDVVVIATDDDESSAILGSTYAALASIAGAVAIVTDGLARDRVELDVLDLPVFAAGVSPNGPFKTGPGEVATPVALAGVPISPGDVLIGDGDGVVVVQPERLADALEAARAIEGREGEMARAISQGEMPDWIRALIAAAPVHRLETPQQHGDDGTAGDGATDDGETDDGATHEERPQEPADEASEERRDA